MSNIAQSLGFESKSSAEHDASSWPRKVRNLGATVVGLAIGVEVVGAALGVGGSGLAIRSVAAMEVGAATALAGIVAETIVEGA
jgi:hypothetical protein